MKNTPLIVSFPEDYHAAAVAWGLERLGCNPVWLPVTRAFDRNSITLTVEPGSGSQLTIDDHIVAPGSTCWLRRPYPKTLSTFKLIHPHDRMFAEGNAAEYFLEILYWLEHNCFCVNSHTALKRASLKAIQLQVALEVGLSVPVTVMTNSASVARLRVENTYSVNKPFVHDHWQEDGVKMASFTSVVTREDMEASQDTIAACPVLLQSALESDTELRVVIFGKTVFAIDLQWNNRGATRVDWRKESNNTNPKRVDLPSSVVDALLSLMTRLNLQFAAVDLIRSGGLYHFLEVNPAGQWIWLSDQSDDLPLLDAFVQFIASGNPEFVYGTRTGLTVTEYHRERGRALDESNSDLNERGVQNGVAAYNEYYNKVVFG